MAMHAVDWWILGLSTLALAIFSIYSVRHMKGVADFLAANRCAKRYLLTIASGIAGIGAVSAVAQFEMCYTAGFGPAWWGLMSIPLGVILTLSGYMYYRFRETRALTLAQFFEMRYSKPFRVYAGIITWISGVVNFAIFPIVEARFFVWFCGLPVHYWNVGGFQIDLTSATVMILTIGTSLLFATMGGQITVMVTDCAQGIFCMFAYLFIVVFLMVHFGWSDIADGLKMAPAHASMLNPYDAAKLRDFNVWYFLIGLFGRVYGAGSWQGTAGYQSAALTPHEQKMGAVIGGWRVLIQNVLLFMIPVCAFAFMHLPKYADGAAAVEQTLSQIPSATLQTQMRVPVALSHILPVGLKGLFATIMLFFLITTQDTYMHSWGTMFIQDVILPFRKTPFAPKTQINLLRISIIGVGVFAFIFGLLFKQTEYILMFFAITGAIVSGLGACIIGGIYWVRGTPAGAWVALTVGWMMALGRIVLQQAGDRIKHFVGADLWFARAVDAINGVNSQVIWFYIMLSCLTSYVVVSLLTRNEEGFSMERMLHRGRYAIAGEHVRREPPKAWWNKILAITDEFTTRDRIWAYALVIWNFGWLVCFAVATVCYALGRAGLASPMTEDGWSAFWKIWVWMQVLIGIPATIWFTVGGVSNLRELFVRLATMTRDAADDGRVMHHHLATEADNGANAKPE